MYYKIKTIFLTLFFALIFFRPYLQQNLPTILLIRRVSFPLCLSGSGMTPLRMRK